MRKVQLFIAGVLISFSVQAQSWLDIGFKGGAGSTFIANGNMIGDKVVQPLFTIGYSYGGKLGYNFNELHELTFDFMITQLNQKYSIADPDTAKKPKVFWSKNLGIKVYDMALLYRHHKNGTYFEIGPQYSLIKKASQSNSINNATADVSGFLTKNYFSGVFGFGSDFVGASNFSLLIGFRFAYTFTDIINDKGGRGQQVSYPLNDHLNDKSFVVSYDNYKATKPFTALLVIEANFDMGYFVRAKCNKKRVKFFSF